MTNNNIYFIANWKMFGSVKLVNSLNNVISYSKKNKHKAKIVYCPPYTLLKSFIDKTKNSNIEIGAQDCHINSDYGPHTGAISSKMIKDLGANFVIIGHRARTAADWKLDDLCGGAGRLDVLVRCVTAALWKSHGIRHDTDVWLLLNGPPKAPVTVHINGKKIKYLNPDERSTAALVRNGLIKYKGKEGIMETSPGITMERIGLNEIIKRLPNPILLSEKGADEIGNSQTFILGDDKDGNRLIQEF